MALFFGTALALGAAATLTLALLWRGIRGTWPGRAELALALATLTVVFLALHPFPAPDAVICKPVKLRPFAFLEPYARLAAAGAPPRVWLSDLGVVSAPMNFVLFALIGALFARVRPGLGAAALFAVALSGGIETAQITGLFGLYPCPYRQFDVDDLILNIAGVLAGSGVSNWGRRNRGGC